MTLVEVMVALMVMTAAGQILVTTLSASFGYRVTKEQRGMAVEGAINMVEEMHATPFYDVFAAFNANPDDDPEGPGTARGASFDIPGLAPVPGQASVGRIELPERDGKLVESLLDENLGMPRDLDGDLRVDSVDHSDDYLILPVLVTVEWQGKTGPRRYRLATMLADMGREEDYQ